MIPCSLCTGISGKSQILFALVFTTRYLDLFSNFISIYNTVMKVNAWGPLVCWQVQTKAGANLPALLPMAFQAWVSVLFAQDHHGTCT